MTKPTWTLGIARLAQIAPARWLVQTLQVSRRYRDLVLRRASRAPIPDSPYKVTMLAVGRQRNAEYLTAVSRQLAAEDIRIWSLDGPITGLEPQTRGIGPGTKFELLNRLLAENPIPDDHWIVIADDDVVLSHGSGPKLIAIGEKAGFDLFQPTHSLASLYTYDFLLALPWVRAELVSFVEIGPLFVVSPRGRPLFLPFPSDIGMGFGLELRWWEQSLGGARLGTVSDCRMVHCAPVGASYAFEDEKMRFKALLQEHGLTAIGDAQIRLGRWWRWSVSPPWAVPQED